ncbi:phosphatase PAP2 family protein [Paenibacillus sp. GSMTC-2017]|uniref:phosphatase PAP2 family protein n=1 Tax=Paenibacillus sp. GSMTC-2017 TaxID=2794350 RepID=UPI0018D79A0E|nr:phosphatase PAP2 family protein [Paenibacillus sp. GSMTC-2017]MBH5318425.1 phosphatase PAP2 family protein [Paenibacillus sp. GSMTC-2017]
MSTRGLQTFFVCFIILWAALMLVFSFADLPVSKAVYNENNSSFGQFFEKFGAFPAYIVLFISGNILFSTAKHRIIVEKILFRIVGGITTVIGGITVSFRSLFGSWELANSETLIISMFITLVVTVVVQWLLRFVPIHTLKAYNRAAWAGIIIIFAEMTIVNVLKIYWGRMRFRNMEGDYTQFTNWFLPQGLQLNGVTSETYKSFPSAHSANGWTMIVWMLYMPFVNKWRTTMLLIAIVWGALTSYSRIVMGDHFATDVLFGAFITICCTFVVCKIFRVELYPGTK